MAIQLKNLLLVTIFTLFNIYLLNAQTPPTEGDWEVITELTDEFEEGIDNTKWLTRDPKWDGRFPSYFESSNISVEDGLLQLTCREINDQDKPPYSSEGAYTHATAAFKSRIKIKYGYFEIEAKASDSKYWNSFWFYDYTKTDWTEIGVFEIVSDKNYLVRTAHLWYARPDYEGTPEDHIKRQQEVAPWITGWDYYDGFFAEYHVYGLDWNKDRITWYVDGEAVFSAKNQFWHQELYMIIDAGINMAWPGLPDSTEEVFQIKYIRSWRKKAPVSSTTNSLKIDESKIYPNPGTGVFNLNYSSAYNGEVDINVFTIDGKIIDKLKLQKNETEFLYQIDLTTQDMGVYLIQFTAGEYHTNHRIIKRL